MPKGALWVLALTGVLANASPLRADAINTTFEAGTFWGWSLTIPSISSPLPPLYFEPGGTARIMDHFVRPEGNVLPVGGSYFAAIGTGEASFFPQSVPAFDVFASQNLFIQQGTLLSGWSSFYNGDFFAQDSAFVRILDGDGIQIATPWAESSGTSGLSSVPYGSATQWVQWQWQAPETGQYTLKVGVTSQGDNDLGSYGFYDTIQVPEPSSALFLGIGLASLILRRRES